MKAGRRILIIVSVANLAGAQIAALRLARGLAERGHRVKVVFLYERDRISEPDHPYEVLLKKAAPGAADYLRIAVDLNRIIRRERPDVVLSFLPLANVLGQAAALGAGIRRRIVSHRIPVNTAGAVMRRLDTLWAWLGVYGDVIAVSEGVKATCQHYPARLKARTEVVHNGIRAWRASRLTREEARSRYGVSADALVLVAVGRLATQKNYGLLLDVMQRLDRAALLIAGEGPERPALERDIARRGLAGRVRLLGVVPQTEIPDLLTVADIFAQPSIFEGQSNAVLEALQAGVPVIAQDVPEQRETIAEADGAVAGVLVPVGDIGAWVAAIARLSDESEVAAARAVAARRADLFTYEAMIDGFERVLIGER
jgi:glycosyltransferase involved in cell wall biosynthesis